MLGIESPILLLNIIIGLPLLVLFIKVHSILMVVKPKWWPVPTAYICVFFIALFFVVFELFTNFLKLGEDVLSKISLLNVLFAAIPSAILLYFIFDVINRLFGSKAEANEQ